MTKATTDWEAEAPRDEAAVQSCAARKKENQALSPEAFEKWNLLFQSNILHYPWSRETPRSFWNGPTRDAWIELKQPILIPTGQSLGNSITSSSLLC